MSNASNFFSHAKALANPNLLLYNEDPLSQVDIVPNLVEI